MNYNYPVLARAARKPESERGRDGRQLYAVTDKTECKTASGLSSVGRKSSPPLGQRVQAKKNSPPSSSAEVIEAYVQAIQTADCKHVSLNQSIASPSISCI